MILRDLTIGDIILPSPKRLKPNTKDHLIRRILEHGQPKAIKVEVDLYRKGKYRLIDGYHTIWALRELGYNHVVAQVIEDKNANTRPNGMGPEVA